MSAPFDKGLCESRRTLLPIVPQSLATVFLECI